jgi:hypothetical protein
MIYKQQIFGVYMRKAIFLLFLLLFLCGCDDSDVAGPSSRSIVSVTDVQGGIRYTYSLNKAIYDVNDTLITKLKLYNLSNEADTIYDVFPPPYWSLKTADGHVIMYGPHIIFYRIVPPAPIFLGPHQSREVYQIQQTFYDTSGALVKAGLYVLNGQFPGGKSFTFDIVLYGTQDRSQFRANY